MMNGFFTLSLFRTAQRFAVFFATAAILTGQETLQYGDSYERPQGPQASQAPQTPQPGPSPRVMESSPGRLILPVAPGATAGYGNLSTGATPSRPPDTHQATSSPVPYTPVYQMQSRPPATTGQGRAAPAAPAAPAYSTAPLPQQPQQLQQLQQSHGNVRPYTPQYGQAGSGTRTTHDTTPAPPEAHHAPAFPRSTQPAAQPQISNYPRTASPYNTPQRPAQQGQSQSLEATIQRQATQPGSTAATRPTASESLAPGRNPALDEIFRVLNGRTPGVHLNIWFPGIQELGNVQVAQGATAAEGIALRLGNTPVFVSSNPGITPGRFNVAIGTVEQLRGLVEERELRANTDGHLILRQVPNRSDTWLLIIAGRTRQGLDNAILSLGLAREKLPGVATAAIQDIVLPEAPPFLRREPLRAETLYTFQQMQDIGTGMTMLPTRKLRIEFSLPGDFSPRYNGDLVMDLHYSHPAFYAQGAQQHGGFRGVLPRLSARANDIAEETFYGISQPIIEGGVRGTISIPARFLRQGDNFIDIDFPGAGTEGFQIFSDSTFSLPAWSVSPSLPNLTLTARTAYPFIGQPDGSEIFVYLAGSEIETVESTWTFLAKLAQVSNTLLYATDFSIAGDTKLLGLNPEARHMIVVGKSASVPADYRVGMPEDIFREILHKAEDQVVIRRRNLKEVIMRWRHGESAQTEEEEEAPSRAEIEARNSPWKRHERGYLGSFPPVQDRHGWIILLTAESGLNLRQRTFDLIQPQFWRKVTGASIFWNNTPESLKVYKETPRPRPMLSALDQNRLVEMPLGETMTVRTWVIATVASLTFFITTLYLGLRRKARLRTNFR